MEYYNKLGKPCTASQYITDLIVKRRAEKEKKTLPYNYYKIPEWQKIYKVTIIKANSLLKLYSAEAIVKTLEEEKKIYSLNAPWLPELIEKKEKQLKDIVKSNELNQKAKEDLPKPEKIQQPFSKNIFGKLK